MQDFGLCVSFDHLVPLLCIITATTLHALTHAFLEVAAIVSSGKALRTLCAALRSYFPALRLIRVCANLIVRGTFGRRLDDVVGRRVGFRCRCTPKR